MEIVVSARGLEASDREGNMQPLSNKSDLGEGAVSVALCTFNGARFLKEQLRSIAAQTCPPAELVVCDDGSNDATLAVLAEFAGSVSFPVVIHRNETNIGSTKNFEKAIGLCRGEFIALCDQDDWWEPRKLELLRESIQRSDADGAFSDALLMDGDSRLLEGSLWKSILFDASKGAFLGGGREAAISELLKRNVLTGATLMIRSRIRGQILPFPREWVHDGWIAWMIVLNSDLLAVPIPLVRYRMHGNQQVGVPRRAVKDRLVRAWRTGAQDYLQTANQFSVLSDFVNFRKAEYGKDALMKIQGKVEHARFRGRLPKNLVTRWWRIMRRYPEYREYAQGWRSMLKDALIQI